MSQRALAHVALLGELELLTGSMLVVAEALARLMPEDARKVAASTARVQETLRTRTPPVTLSTRWIIEILGRLAATSYVTRDYDPTRHRMPVWRFPGMLETGTPEDAHIRRLLLTLQKTQAERLRHRARQTHLKVVQQHEAVMRPRMQLVQQQRREIV